ncbi:phosphotransferase enzyme family protein [Blastomyces dermatitidis ER-3]|uniref:Phosphotransferase enzyme family protein n=1 Tax=Ajellomyces dermatitidis (strain ER-3 / ATCC MYA-2586) TaxID=559297 RepID=A0ABP2F589_AJEDR|nr:phosphotransferase enzyme family protein [Blastomyces dermatitidis ER-3]EEQ92196.2 phosphotransferase enzyme family protein [Blastomyces dermatitidis ER-3]
MEKMPGVPLSKVWWHLQPNKKLKILLQVVDYQRRWTHTKFTGFGSLYYAKDVDPRRQDPLYVKDGEAVTDSQFAIGPSVAREWSDEGGPLFDHCVDPCFLNYNGPDVGDNLGRPAMPESIKSLQGEEKTAALNEFLNKALMIAWRSLVRSKNPEQYRMTRLQQSPSANLLHLSRRIFELGEAHFCALLLDLQHEWRENSQSNSNARRFPLTFTEPETNEIEADMRRADLGIKLMKDIERDLGNLCPEKGVMEHENYEQVKALLKERKEELIA